MHTYLLLLHYTLFVPTLGAKLLEEILRTVVHKQLSSSFNFSQSDPMQHLLLSVVNARRRTSTHRLYIWLLWTQPSTLRALFIARQITLVACVSSCAKWSRNYPYRMSLPLAVSSSLAQLSRSSLERLRGDPFVLLFTSFCPLRLSCKVLVGQ